MIDSRGSMSKFTVRENHLVTPESDELVAIEYCPHPTSPNYSSVWAMSADDIRDLHATLSDYLSGKA